MTGDATIWPEVIGALLRKESPPVAALDRAMALLLEGQATDAQIAGFAVALRAKGETSAELAVMVRAMMRYAQRVEVSGDLVDTCGTGGDSAGTINVSTLAALIATGAGARVAKHGNRAASSQCGSADVLETLGVDHRPRPGGRRPLHRGDRYRLLLRADVPSGAAIRGPGAARARGAHDVQLPRPARQPGRCAPPGARRIGSEDGRTDGRHAP